MSRCQRFDFKRIKPDDIIRRMREIAMGDGLSLTDDAYRLLAQLADGSMRDGLSILERCIAASGTSLTYDSVTAALGIAGNGPLFRMADCINAQDSQGILEIVSDLMNDGKDLHVFIDNLTEHYRNLLVCKVSKNPETLLNRDAEEIIKLKAQAEKTSYEKLSNAAAALSKARSEAKWVKEPRIIYELALLKLTKLELDASYDAILDRLSECEEKIKEGITVNVAAPTEPAPEKKPEPKKKQPSARLFVPIDVSSLTADTPVVSAARRWDKIAQAIAKKYPHVAAAVVGRQLTIDGEGIILIYRKNEMMLKRIAATFAKQIADVVRQASGTDFVIKTAFLEDIEDNIIDFWKIDGSQQNENTGSDDPIDVLQQKFPEIVEITDESEFVGYNPSDDNFTQSEMSGENAAEEDEENGEEEFLDDEEKNSEQ